MDTDTTAEASDSKSYFVAFPAEYREMLSMVARYFGFDNNLSQVAKNMLSVGYKVFAEDPAQYLKILNSSKQI